MNKKGEIVKKVVLDEDIVRIKSLFEKLHKKYGDKAVELIKQLEQEEFVPLSIFSSKTSPLESLCYYMHKEKNHNLSEIGELLGRSQKTVWQAVNDAKKKNTSFNVNTIDERYNIPVSLFSDRTFSILENLCIYLRDNFHLKYSEIAFLLNKNQRTIWTCCNRAKKKAATQFKKQSKMK